MQVYTVSTDAAGFDLPLIHRFLSTQSYWAKGIPLDTVLRSIENALCFAVYHRCDGQVGFARVISDYATFGYLADVFVIEEHRGKGLSKLLLREIMAHPKLQGLRRLMLATADAHDLYKQFGFGPVVPERLMEIVKPDSYAKA